MDIHCTGGNVFPYVCFTMLLSLCSAAGNQGDEGGGDELCRDRDPVSQVLSWRPQ